MEQNKDLMYRYQDVVTSSGDEDYGYTTHVTVQLFKFKIIRYTRGGKWIEPFPGFKPRFVLNKSKRHYACDTIEKARESFIARKQAQIRILEAQLRHVKTALRSFGVITNG